ncbi:caspase domain-containing protein [Infundibulicybe gibba]|nr:caspase domain-containing protein [Infundibulicybe gibba]
MFRLRPQYKILPGQVYGNLQPSGRRKALIIAIQNYSVHGQLSCPHKDAKKMENLLRFTYGYREEDIVIMLDSPATPAHLQPTYTNIMRELRNLLADQQPGDTFAFHFAGHSDQIPNYDGTERDNRDECIITIDNQLIRDNDLNKYLVQPLLPGSRLYAFLDTCHSGTLLDLPHDRCSTACRLKRNSRPFGFSLANAGAAFGAFRQSRSN